MHADSSTYTCSIETRYLFPWIVGCGDKEESSVALAYSKELADLHIDSWKDGTCEGGCVFKFLLSETLKRIWISQPVKTSSKGWAECLKDALFFLRVAKVTPPDWSVFTSCPFSRALWPLSPPFVCPSGAVGVDRLTPDPRLGSTPLPRLSLAPSIHMRLRIYPPPSHRVFLKRRSLIDSLAVSSSRPRWELMLTQELTRTFLFSFAYFYFIAYFIKNTSPDMAALIGSQLYLCWRTGFCRKVIKKQHSFFY